MLKIENRARNAGFSFIIGVDEAGRGPLAGPVVAAAVALRRPDFSVPIRDSKKLSRAQREEAFHEIFQCSYVGIGIISENVIDQNNILQATFFAMHNAVVNLIRLRRRPRTSVRGGRRRVQSNDGTASARFRQRSAADELLRSQRRKHFGEAESFKGTTGFSPWGSIAWLPPAKANQKQFTNSVCLLIDGNCFRSDLPYRFKTIIKGDERVLSIMCASIVAKVVRDRILNIYHRVYPGYGFDRHKGYATEEHKEAIRRLGPSLIQRRTFQCQL